MNKRLLLLLVLAGVIWAAVYFWPASGPEEDLGIAAPPPWFTAGDLLDVRSIRVASPTGSYELVKGDAGWIVLGPAMNDGQAEPYLASQDKVESLLAFIAGNVPDRGLGRIEDLAQYGLDNPAYEVTLVGDGNQTIALGGANPSGTGLYALSSVDPGECLLLSNRYEEVMGRESRFYHDLRLTDVSDDQVDKVRVEWGGQGWEAARHEGGYVFTWPEELAPMEVSMAEMDLAIHELTTMEALTFLAGDPMDQHPGQAPLVTVSFWTAGAEEPAAVIEVHEDGNEDSPYFGRSTRQEHYFVLPGDVVDKLTRSPFHLRERGVLDVDVGAVTRQVLRQDTNDSGRVLVKTDSGWQDEARGEEVAGMDMLLWRLTDLKFEAEPVSELPAGATRILAWELSAGPDQPLAAVDFFLDPNLPEDQCWVMVQDEDKYYPVSDSLLEDLQGQLLPAGADAVEEDASAAPAEPTQGDAAPVPASEGDAAQP